MPEKKSRDITPSPFPVSDKQVEDARSMVKQMRKINLIKYPEDSDFGNMILKEV